MTYPHDTDIPPAWLGLRTCSPGMGGAGTTDVRVFIDWLRSIHQARTFVLREMHAKAFEPDLAMPVATRIVDLMRVAPDVSFSAHEMSEVCVASLDAIRKSLQRLGTAVERPQHGHYWLRAEERMRLQAWYR